MSLKYILDEIEEEVGSPITSDADTRTLWVKRVNKAAQLVFNMGDFDGLMDEEVFDFNVGEQQVTLPSYVGHFRGGRYYDRRLRIPVAHAGNRYGPGYGNETWYLKDYREKSRSPLAQSITNQSTLRFTLPLAETSEVKIAIQGQTDNSLRFNEEVSIPAGVLSAESIGNYIKLLSMRKNRITFYDVAVLDAEDNELAKIPNSQYDSLYRVFQILDTPYFTTINNSDLAIEVYFKKRFVPFASDNDEFVGGPLFDDAIVFKILELRAKSTEAKIGFSKACKDALKDLQEDSTPGKRRKIEFSKHPALGMQYDALGRQQN